MCSFLEVETDPGVCKYSWATWLVIWLVLNISPVWYTIYSNKKIRPAKDLDQKYKPFARLDYKDWSYLTVLFTHFLFIPRFVLAFLWWMSLVITTFIVLIGHKKGTPYKKW